MIRRPLALAVTAILLAGTLAPATTLAADPWTISSSSNRVAASFTSDTSGTDVALALVNRTSIADAAGLGSTAGFILDALGLGGTYSQSATWTAGSGPQVRCPPTGVNLGCWVHVSGVGTVLIPGSVRAALLAGAPAGTGQTDLAVAPGAISLTYDVTLIAIGIALETAGIAGARADMVTTLALELYPEAAGAGAALARGDARTAGIELLALSERAWSVIHQKAIGASIGILANLVPGVLQVKFGIAVAKAILPLANLAVAVLHGASSTVTLGYGGGVTGASPASDGADTWTATGDLVAPRSGHTAILFGDGRVLVFGGSACETCPSNGSDVIATTEIYAPLTGRWSAAADWPDPRAGTSSALLRDGRVLVVGGWGPATQLGIDDQISEIFDPRTGRWSRAADMLEPNQGRAMATLPDGRVLVVGGWYSADGATDAEAFDPVSGRWSAFAPMLQGRFGATLTPLLDGRILVAGGREGSDGGAPIGEAEIFDPKLGRWAVTGSLSTGRSDHTALRLPDGRVLVVGGDSATYGLCIGPGCNVPATPPPSPPELFDPVSGTWQQLAGPSDLPPDGIAIVTKTGWVVLSTRNAASRRIWLFNAGTEQWRSGTPMPVERAFETMTSLSDGRVLVAGGGNHFTVDTAPTTYDLLPSSVIYQPPSP